MAEALVPVMALAAATTWTAVLVLVVPFHRRHDYLPRAVQEALFVAVLAASVGGAVASLGFVEVLSSSLAAAAASAWRAAVLAAGLYALIGAWRARGR